MYFVLKRLPFLLLLSFLLAACSTTEVPQQAKDYSHVGTLKIDSSTSQKELEAYGGDVLVYEPEAGFAILGFSNPPENQLIALATNSTYKDTVASGFSAWAGGFSAWAGGWSAWAGGTSTATSFSDNAKLWKQIKLSEGQAKAGNLGKGIKVAIIDTGIDLDHPGFAGKLAPQSEWKDFVDDDNLPDDAGAGKFRGHGTAVAGIITQVAPSATLLPIRVLSPNGEASLSDVILAIDHAIKMNAKIINLSLGASGTTLELQLMLALANLKGVVLVASVGNENSKNITHPANYNLFDLLSGVSDSTVTAVTSVSLDNKKSSFANYGSEVDVAAPGENIRTLLPDNKIASVTGTSFATPIVSGAYALALGEKSASFFTLFSLEDNLTATSVDPWSLFYKYKFDLGHGIMDVNAFISRY